MPENNYELKFELSDGSEKTVTIAIPQGPAGPIGPAGPVVMEINEVSILSSEWSGSSAPYTYTILTTYDPVKLVLFLSTGEQVDTKWTKTSNSCVVYSNTKVDLSGYVIVNAQSVSV